MEEIIGMLRGISFGALSFRMALAVLFAGILGLEREQKRHPAGFRTYILVCVGATTAMLLGQYEACMMAGMWKQATELVGVRLDASRLGAQVINGIGFLGAGTIIVTETNESQGMTTAAGLWATACMGLTIGAGFYECTFVGFILIIVCFKLLEPIKKLVVDKGRNIGVYCELEHIYDIGTLVSKIKEKGIDIRGVELDKDNEKKKSSAVVYMRLPKGMNHTQIVTGLSELACIRAIDELNITM